MKRILILSFVAFIALFASNCSNEFDLVDKWKDIPVVYGLINPSENVHYIRIEKAFLDPSTSAFDVAQRADSIYYDPSAISVKLEDQSSGQVFNLERVNGTDVNFPREEGIFASDPNYLYTFAGDIVEERRYIFRLDRGDNLPADTASFVTIKEPRVTGPGTSNGLNFGRYDRSTNLRWMAENGKIFDVSMIIRFDESLESDQNTFVEKTLVWPIAQNILNESDESQIVYELEHEDFYRFIGRSLEEKSVRRILKSLDIKVDAAGQELFDFVSVSSANTGITSSQSIPSFTNLSDGLGIITSRNSGFLGGYFLNAQATDSLQLSIHTADLNFQN